MADPATEAEARTRWGIINLVRLAGVAMVVLGVFGHEGVLAMPAALAWILLAAGLLGLFLVPRMLARKWRSPRE